MTVQCIWLNTTLDKEDFALAESHLNDTLNIKSVNITKTDNIDGVAIVYFDIDTKDANVVLVTRLHTHDIKWLTDYPQYDDTYQSGNAPFINK